MRPYRRNLSVLVACIFLYILSFQIQAARVVAEKRECATCHIAWISEFKVENIQTLIPNEPRPVVETGRQDVVSTERMCFSCHDGYVLDSRFLWLNQGHSHPVGMVPSDKVKIPKEEGKTIFPLNDDGKVYCGTCHSAHGVEWGDKLSPVFLRAQNIDSSLCKTCHVDRKGDQDGHVNHPLDKEVPKEAKKLLKYGSKFSRKNEVICQSCHRIHGSKQEKLLVVKNDRSQLCVNCHMEKSGKDAKGRRQHFTHPVDTVPKDASIPKLFEESGSKFGPGNEIECETCHQVHLAPTEKLLVLGKGNLDEGICVNCHDNKRQLLSTGHNLLRDGGNALPQEDQRPSSNLGVCGVCHNIHGGKGPKMWARKLKSNGDKVASLCLSCHSEGGPAEKHPVGEYSHPVGAALPSQVKPDLPLFTPSGTKTSSRRYGRVTCPTCHDVHGPASKKKKKPTKKERQNGFGKYLRKGEGDLLSLCRTCHKEKWSVKRTKHDLDAEKQDSMPLGICGNCHQVHNGKGPRMWAREGDLDEKDLGTLCKNCHTKDGLAEDKTTGSHSHPIGVSVEKAGVDVTRRGWVGEVAGKRTTKSSKLPLYDDKGRKLKRGSSGNVACATCHDPHDWSSDKGTGKQPDSSKQEGDARDSFLRIPAAPDGELCVTCHMSKATVRKTDHDLSVTVPDATNKLGEGFEQSGICGQCHTVHNAVQDYVLWGRPPGQAVSTPETLCRSCHLDGEIAQEKVPEKALHPLYVMAWDGDIRDADKRGITHLPVFSNNGSRAKTGYITCPTCHNVHQWRGRKAEEGPGINEEGDVLSSFLRMGSTENGLCADCHGLDAIFRYKYFHGADFKNRNDD